jgi:predicted metal-binding protein
LRSTGHHIPRYDNNGDETDFHYTDLVENNDCETCDNCQGEGCEECDFEGYIDWSEPNGMN